MATAKRRPACYGPSGSDDPRSGATRRPGGGEGPRRRALPFAPPASAAGRQRPTAAAAGCADRCAEQDLSSRHEHRHAAADGSPLIDVREDEDEFRKREAHADVADRLEGGQRDRTRRTACFNTINSVQADGPESILRAGQAEERHGLERFITLFLRAARN